MYAKILLTIAVSMFVALPVAANESYADTTYQVQILRIGASNFVTACFTFRADGRLSSPHKSMTLAWAQTPGRPEQFQAITNPGEHSIVPYQVAVHGFLMTPTLIFGSSIDEYGRTYAFFGEPDADCESNVKQMRSIDACRDSGLVGEPEALSAQDTCTPRAFTNQVTLPYQPQVAPCTVGPCDPITNPLREPEDVTAISRLRGRSFALTMGTARGDVREQCWSFDADGTVRSSGGKPLTWSPDYLYDLRTTFQAVGEGPNGEGRSFNGALVGDSLLEIYGMEAHNGKTQTSYGFAQEVKACRSE